VYESRSQQDDPGAARSLADPPRRRVIYDCDNTMGKPLSEIDDGLTLLYLLGRPDLELIGVTTTFGNGALEDVLRCTRQLLDELGRGDIPLLRGAASDGDHDSEAAAFLAETVCAAPGEIDVLATGPLGNLAGAAARAPEFFASARQLGCMGGYLRKPFRIGWRDLGELNLSADAAASHAVLTAGAAATRVALFSGHVCLQAPFGRSELRTLARRSGWSRARIATIRRWLWTFGLHCGVPRFYLWDLLPAVWLNRPELFLGGAVDCDSTVEDLRAGLVRVAPATERSFALPTAIGDAAGFYETLFAAWERA
jgi:purine nucleosidase